MESHPSTVVNVGSGGQYVTSLLLRLSYVFSLSKFVAYIRCLIFEKYAETNS